VSPEELATVERSWVDLRRRKADLLEHVAGSLGGFDDNGWSELAGERARWLTAAVDELVGMLSCPSRLASRARELARSWPVTGTMPCFAVEGRAWMAAVQDLGVECNELVVTAWHHAWLLLSEVLVDEALSPFAGRRRAAIASAADLAQPAERDLVEQLRGLHRDEVGPAGKHIQLGVGDRLLQLGRGGNRQ
jgi:hypothetical protein